MFTSYPNMILSISQCYVEEFKCTVIKNSNNNLFTLESLTVPHMYFANTIFEVYFWVNGGNESNTDYKGELLGLFDGEFYVINECSKYVVN